MAGDPETRARAVLDEMQSRISQGPYVALGLFPSATCEDVRAAFLALTKQFHPARFGRMSNELQRLSNEVFLGIKSAHDQLQKSLGAGSMRLNAVQQTGAIPTISGEGSGRTVAPQLVRRTSQIPVQQAPGQRPSSPALPPAGRSRGTTQPPPQSAAPTPTVPRAASPVQRAPTPASPLPTARAAPSSPMGIPIQRPSTPPTTRPVTPPQASASSSQAIPRQGPAFDERSALRECMMLLNERKWPDARQALHTLATKVPQSKSYRALLSYARGREAQAANRPDEALLEIQRALQLDPDLDLAKQALAELSRRR